MNIAVTSGPNTANDSGYPSQHSRPSGSDYYIAGFNPPRPRDGPDQPVEYTWRPSFARRYSTAVGSALPGDSQDPSQKPSDVRVIFQEPPRQEKRSLLFFHGICFFIAGVTTYNWFYIVLAAGSDWIGVASGEPLSGYDGHFAEATGHSFAPLCHERSTSLVLLTYMLPVFAGKIVAMLMLGTPIALRIVGIAIIGLVGGTLIGWVSSLIPSIIGLLLVGFYGGFCEATFISLSSTFLKSATAWFTTGMGVISVVNAVLYAVFHDYIHRPMIFLMINATFPAVMALTFFLLSRNPPASSNHISHHLGFNFKARMADLGKHYKHYLSLTLLFTLSFVIHQGLFQVLSYTQLDVLTAHQQYHIFDAVFFIGYSIAMLSVKIFRFTLTWLLVVLQGANLIILTTDAIFHFVRSVWILIFFIFYTGLLFGGGLVGAIYELYKTADPIAREFGLAALCAWTEVGVLGGAIVGVFVHNSICASVTAS